MTIVTFEEFRDHLGLTGEPPNSNDLMVKLDQAHGMVLNYLARPADVDWTARIESWDLEGGSPHEDAPRGVHAAILTLATELNRFRGDEPEQLTTSTPDDLAPRIKSMLRPWKRPVFA